MLEQITSWGLVALVLIFVVREVSQALYEFAHWPRWLVAIFERGKTEELRRILVELGVGPSERRAIATGKAFERLNRVGTYAESARRVRSIELLKRAGRPGSYQVGRRFAIELPYYLDVFSESLRPDYAEEAARVMLSHLRANFDSTDTFTAVAGIKAGSPLLAARVAELLSTPLLLHRNAEDAKPAGVGIHPRIDGVLSPGDQVLLVDDSSTGGRMVRECIETVSSLGASVTVVLVLFEPLGKDARKTIEGLGVKFVSVVQMTPKTIKSLGL